MKKTIIYLAAIVILASCGGKKEKQPEGDLGQKQEQLDSLKKVRADLDKQIKDLEDQIALASGDSTSKAELVAVQIVAPAEFTSYIDLQAKVDADENVTVTPQLPGAIKRIYVTEGQSVHSGQVLAELDNEASKKQIETLETQLSFAQDVYNKQKALWDQKIGTEVQYLSAKNNVETLQKQIAAANQQIEMTKLVSPINGVVDQVDIKVGQIASPGYNGIRVVNTSHLKVTGLVSEAYASFVQQGDKVKLEFPDLHSEIDSKITFASKVIDPQSRSFTAESKIPDNAVYKPNMVVVMKIADYEKPDAIITDLNLIQNSNDGKFVYVAAEENGKKTAQRRTITVGRIYNGKAEITSGLNPGDKLITSGYEDLVPGQEIVY